jgi:hypothetical protein
MCIKHWNTETHQQLEWDDYLNIYGTYVSLNALKDTDAFERQLCQLFYMNFIYIIRRNTLY